MKFIPFSYFSTTFLLFISTFPLISQNIPEEKTALNYRLESLGSVASQSTTLFWITNNSQGLIPLEANNIMLRGSISFFHNPNKNFRIESGLDIVGGNKSFINDSIGATRPGVFIHQMFASFSYRFLKLTIGSKPVNNSILDRSLSSGDFSFSPNARPVPEINLAFPEFVAVPYTKKYLQIKGDFALGKFIDNAYTQAVIYPQAFYAQDILLHHKSFFISIGKSDGNFPLKFIFGLENCAQWGGWNTIMGDMPRSFKDFLRVVIGAGGAEDAPFGDQVNRLGNHLGTYSFRLGYTLSTAEVAIYKQHYFEDNSGMELANWRDGIWGIECSFFKSTYLKKILFEYVQTLNQSGPFHFPYFHKDFPEGMKVRIGGNDNYYNHSDYPSGWSHFGRAIGNPLLTSPIYNRNGDLRFENNRIKAYHTGAQGNILPSLSYRILGTFMYGYGLQHWPFLERKYGFSSLFEFNYCFPQEKGWEVGFQFATDRGSFYGNNIGALLRIAKSGQLMR